MGVNGEVLQLYAVYKKPYFYYKSREDPYQVLQVMCVASERAMKSKVRMIITIVPSSFFAVGIVTHAVHL